MREFNDLESILEKLEGELREVSMNAQALERNYCDLVDMRHTLAYVQLHTDANIGKGKGFAPNQEGTGSADSSPGEQSDTKAILPHEEFQEIQPDTALNSLKYKFHDIIEMN